MLFSCACDKFKWNRADRKIDRRYLYFFGLGILELDVEKLDFVTCIIIREPSKFVYLYFYDAVSRLLH